MALSSTSTIAQIDAEIEDNASYEADGSVVKCKAYITALLFKINPLPRRAVKGGRGGQFEVEEDLGVTKDMLSYARRWLANNAGVASRGVGVVHADLRSFRQ